MIVMTTTMTTMTMKTTRTMTTTTTATTSLMQNLHRFGVWKKAQETPRNTYRHVLWGGNVGGISEPTQKPCTKRGEGALGQSVGPRKQVGQGLEIVPRAPLFGPLATCGRAPQTGQAQHVAHGCRCRHPFQACRLFGCSSGNSAARAVECQIQQSNSVWHAAFTYCNLADPCVCAHVRVRLCVFRSTE